MMSCEPRRARASRDASPSDVPDWPKDGARVSDLARLGDDITPEKHARRARTTTVPRPIVIPLRKSSKSSPRNALLYIALLSARARTTSKWTSRRPWRRTARASRRFWKMRRLRARRARARRRFSPGSRTRRARLMPRRSHCERLCTKKSVSRRHSHCKDSKRRRRRWRSRRDRVARRRRARRDAAMAPPHRKQKHAVAAAKRARAETRAAECAPCGPPLGRARRAHSWRRHDLSRPRFAALRRRARLISAARVWRGVVEETGRRRARRARAADAAVRKARVRVTRVARDALARWRVWTRARGSGSRGIGAGGAARASSFAKMAIRIAIRIARN